MPTVTLIEARNLLERIDTKIHDYRRMVDKKFSVTNVTEISEAPSRPANGDEEVIVEHIEVPTTETLESLHKTIDKIYVERARIEVALRQFEATATFDY